MERTEDLPGAVALWTVANAEGCGRLERRMMDPHATRLDRAVRSVTSGEGLESVLHNTVTAAREALGVAFAAVGAFGPEGFVSHFEPGLDEPSLIADVPSRAGIESALRRLVDRAEAGRHHAPPIAQVIQLGRGPVGQACLGVPVRGRERARGGLLVCRDAREGAFTSDDEDFLKGLAAVTGQSLAVVDLLARVRQLSTVSERELIGRDLADTVIQQLFATGLSVQGLTRHVSSPEDTLRGIAAIIGQIDETIKQIRAVVGTTSTLGTVRGLRGGVLDVVRDHALELGFEPSVQFHGKLGAGVDHRCAEAVIGALDHALTEIEWRARATRVELTLVVTDETIELHLQDDDRSGRASSFGGVSDRDVRGQGFTGCEVVRDTSDDGVHLRFRARDGVAARPATA